MALGVICHRVQMKHRCELRFHSIAPGLHIRIAVTCSPLHYLGFSCTFLRQSLAQRPQKLCAK